MRRFGIVILECDDPAETVCSRNKARGDTLETFLQNGLQLYCQRNPNAPAILLQVTRSNMCEMGQLPKKNSVDCLLVTGNSYDPTESEPWMIRLVEYLRDTYMRSHTVLLGFGFGHQIIGRALGIRPHRNPMGFEVSIHDVRLSDIGRKLFGCSKLPLPMMHQDMLSLRMPLGIETLGHSELCANQGIYVPGRVLTLQGHPDLDALRMKELITLRYGRGELCGKEYGQAWESSGTEHAGGHVAGVVWCVLLGDDVGLVG